MKQCYNCRREVPEEDQPFARSVEEKLMEGPQWFSELYSDEFVHCTGGPELFYEDGAPVVCFHCIILIAWKVILQKEDTEDE